jgi:hypothetical protein
MRLTIEISRGGRNIDVGAYAAGDASRVSADGKALAALRYAYAYDAPM